MAAGIAHELNTPLTYIMGNLELLRGAAGSTPAQKEMLASDRGGRRAHHAASPSACSPSAGPPRRSRSPLAVNEVVERSLELCHYQILKGGVQLRKELAPALPRVKGVPNQLEMALINLVVNAVHAMEGGGGSCTVDLGREDGEVEISVADTGPGIPAELQATIFEPFVTTKPEGKGTGLGLSTVLMIVERHKGRIDFTSTPGAGTTFRITLPVDFRIDPSPRAPSLALGVALCASAREIVRSRGHMSAARGRRGIGAYSASRILACRVLTIAARESRADVQGTAARGRLGRRRVRDRRDVRPGRRRASQILLASGAVIALTLTRGSRRD